MKRDGSSAHIEGNITEVIHDWFVDVESGNLHLTSNAIPVINKALPLEKILIDIDNENCDNPPGIGADELYTEPPPTKGGISGQLTTNIAGYEHLPICSKINLCRDKPYFVST